MRARTASPSIGLLGMAAALWVFAASVAGAATLDTVKQRGDLELRRQPGIAWIFGP